MDAEMRESTRLENQRMFTMITEVDAREGGGGLYGLETTVPVDVVILLS